MATRGKRKKDKKRKPRGDSPITVGGGGGKRRKLTTDNYVEVIFDHNDYGPDPDQNDNNTNGDLVLEYLKVNQDDPIRLNANSRVEVRYTNGTTYKIKVNDTKTGVRFNRGRLPYVGDKKHRGEHLQLKDYRIDNDERVPLDPARNWTLKFHTKNARPKRKRR